MRVPYVQSKASVDCQATSENLGKDCGEMDRIGENNREYVSSTFIRTKVA